MSSVNLLYMTLDIYFLSLNSTVNSSVYTASNGKMIMYNEMEGCGKEHESGHLRSGRDYN